MAIPTTFSGHKKTVIIGGGVGGIFTAKELSQSSQDFALFDMMPRPGGVYARFSYPDMHFTTSTQTAAIGDFPWKGAPHHWSIPEFLSYLDDYVAHYGFADDLHFNAKVESARRLGDQGDKWEVTVHFKKWHSHFSHGETLCAQKVEERKEVWTCDHLVVASGTHNAWEYPEYEGLAGFEGEVYHSSMFHDLREKLAGKELLLVGTGESGCDLANLAAKVCKQVHVSVRKHSGVYFPREFESVPADTVDCRAIYSLSRVEGHKSVVHGFKKRFEEHSYDHELFKLVGSTNHSGNRSALNSYGVKTFDLFHAVRDHGAKIQPGVEKFDGKKVYFTDGSVLQPDAVMFSTGYCLRFPFFEEHESELSARIKDMRKNWKHMVLPELGDKLFLAGFARPNMTSLFIPAELQARCAGAVIRKEVVLPGPEDMIAQAAADAKYYTEVFSEGTCKRLRALVDHLHYNDNLAAFIGASPPMVKAFFTDPELFVHLFFGSLNGAQYRFSGPNAVEWSEAAKAVKGIPLHRNYARACLKLHLRTVNLAFPIMLTRGLFSKDFRPVGYMHRAPFVFWALVAAVLGWSAAFTESPLFLGSSLPLAVLWLAGRAYLLVMATFCAVLSATVAVAYMYSPKSNPPGVRWHEAAAKYKTQ